MPDTIDFVVIPFVLSFGIAMGVSFVGILLSLRWRGAMKMAAPLLLGAGFLAGFGRITEAMPAFPPAGTKDWICYLTVVAGITGAILGIERLPMWARGIVMLLLCACAYTIVFLNPLRDPETMPTIVKLVAIATVAGMGWWWVLQESPTGMGRISGPLVMGLISLLGGILLMLSASAMYGRLGLAFAGASTALLLTGAFYKESFGKGYPTVMVITLGSVLLAGHYYAMADHRWINLSLMGSAPLLMVGKKLIPGKWGTGWRGHVASFALMLLPLMIALIIAVLYFIQDSQSVSSEYGY